MGTVIKMVGAIAGGSEAAIATIDVPMPGNLLGVDWAIQSTLATDFFQYVQLSFRSTASFSTNDDRGVISEVRFGYEITTTGAGLVGANKYVNLPEIPIMGGERLYLHSLATASVVGIVSALVHFSFDLDKISTRRR